MASRELTGVLLVGGASRRFGSPKVLAPFDGTTLGEHAWGLLAACNERLALGKAADRLELPLPMLDDGTEVRAPIAGVVAGLRAARHEVCVFLPVDTPRMTPAAIRTLGEACKEAAVTAHGPLPGAYARAALPVLERRLADGRLALRDALVELDTAVVTLEPELLANVNSPEELAALGAGRDR